jgi:hypothetical protein
MNTLKMLAAILLTAVVMVVPPGVLFAQSPTNDSDRTQTAAQTAEQTAVAVFDSMLKTLGPLGILGWYLRYNATVVLPKKDEQLVAAIESFREEAAANRVAAEKQAAADRQAAKETHDAIMAEWRSHSERTAATVLEMVRSCSRGKTAA